MLTITRGIFHPLGAAFFSNATYNNTLKVIETSGVPAEGFALAGAREQFLYNYTSGSIEPVPATSAQFTQALLSEIPRYISLWNQVFPSVGVVGYKVSSLFYSGESSNRISTTNRRSEWRS